MRERRWLSVDSVCCSAAAQTRARFVAGSERARVEGRFKIENPELLQRVSQAGGELDDDELIVARHVTAAGRSRAYLGGAQVPAGVCAELTAELVRIYGQSEQERLTEAGRQRELLDRFAGAAAARTARRVLRPLVGGSRYTVGAGSTPCRGTEPGPRDRSTAVRSGGDRANSTWCRGGCRARGRGPAVTVRR